jgi:NadR type nicotinamide-nucleotide adenylyltransferase
MEKEVPTAIRKIVIVGPESTGKTTLSKALAEHFGTVYVEEYARNYLEERNGHYKEHDLTAIAHGQFALEQQQMANANKVLICDTDALVVRVWSEWKYGRYDQAIEEGFKGDELSRIYLLTNIDLPWQPDPLREHPETNDRKGLFEVYHSRLTERNALFDVVSGHGPSRLENALNVIKKRMK